MTTAQGTEEESTSESTTAAPELTPSPALLSLNINQIIRDIGKTLLKEPPGDFPLEGEAICNDMTTGAILDVLYTEAGRSNGEPIYEIIGAKISYITSTWKLSCSGAESVRCRNGSDDLESFAITTSVAFTEVPAEPPAPVKR
ncbi:PREDICTED: uncharacterized protein LOC106808743 [Priapulus caudatus]|uniref:Uncharacterized protein LOC106808743 n=1 Tax=Priapulus caudatus TaxID=37621 RepID=A0ABM1E4F1_PRICU|nr:PREDICTED: uncharacterized protein LOC106808743 [Priapulus caudatus]